MNKSTQLTVGGRAKKYVTQFLVFSVISLILISWPDQPTPLLKVVGIGVIIGSALYYAVAVFTPGYERMRLSRVAAINFGIVIVAMALFVVVASLFGILR